MRLARRLSSEDPKVQKHFRIPQIRDRSETSERNESWDVEWR
jgi:hypothetical protein